MSLQTHPYPSSAIAAGGSFEVKGPVPREAEVAAHGAFLKEADGSSQRLTDAEAKLAVMWASHRRSPAHQSFEAKDMAKVPLLQQGAQIAVGDSKVTFVLPRAMPFDGSTVGQLADQGKVAVSMKSNGPSTQYQVVRRN
ncbi:MAG: hypothetical protein AAF658_19140 [Myxococcota bacterium]